MIYFYMLSIVYESIYKYTGLKIIRLLRREQIGFTSDVKIYLITVYTEITLDTSVSNTRLNIGGLT